MLCKLERRTDQRKTRLIATHASKTLPLPDRIWQLLPMDFVQVGFVVQQIYLRWAATLKQKDDTFGFGRMMCSGQRTARQIRNITSLRLPRLRFRMKQIRQANGTHPHPETMQESTA